MKITTILLATILCYACDKQINRVLETKSLQIKFCESGDFKVLSNKANKLNYLALKDKSPLLQICVDGKQYKSTSMKVYGEKIKLDYADINSKVEIEYIEKDNYITFEIVDINSSQNIDQVIWGPIQVTLTDKVGMSLGVAYDDNYAIGLMGLNLKSCGGFEIDGRERFGNTALRKGDVVIIQGHTKDRSITRTTNSCLQELIESVPVSDGDAQIVGSKFAIYGVVTDQLRSTVEEIEKNEALPYLTHKGEWLKNSLYATSSKFIMGYNVHNIDACLKIAEKAGITCVYHPGVFKSWGTFTVPEKSFPEGYKSVLACSEKARLKNITLGAHTLSNFLHKSDPLVSPIPHKNLQLAGITTLKNDLSIEANEIILADESVRVAYAKDDLEKLKELDIASENKNRETFAIRIGDEIIEYSATSQDGELILLNCKRGAYGTVRAVHKAGSQVGRFVSHYYKVFFPDIQLQDEMAKNLARFFNDTKLERISFDGIEGGLATGHGRYGCDRFIKVFFDNLENKNIIANSSDVMHYSWHYFANQSWGEPWWAKGFRASQLDHRIRVQKFLEEDLLPRKMGQFNIDSKTTLMDIQWVMGLCAGYDAGVDFYVSVNFLESNPNADVILKEIKRYEEIRWKQLLSEKQKQQLRDPFSSYQLELKETTPVLNFVESWAPEGGKLQTDGARNTLPNGIFKKSEKLSLSLDYTHINMQKEPGQPTCVEWQYYNVGKKQGLNFVIRLPHSNESISGLYFKIGAIDYKIPFEIKPKEYVVCEDNQLIHYNSLGVKQESVKFANLIVERGDNTILFDYKGKGRVEGPQVVVNFKIEKD